MALAGADKLIEKISGDAQQYAENLWHDAEDKKRIMRQAVEREIEAITAQIERSTAETVKENERRLVAVNDLEYRKQLLAAKQVMMEKAKSLAMQKLVALRDDKYLQLMKQRLIDCAVGGTGGIIVSKNEKRLGKTFLDDVNKSLKAACGTGEIKMMDEKRDFQGGFVYTNGGLEIDMSLDALLNEAWQQGETDVAAVLFGA